MPKHTIETKFYTTSQNNSGGSFDHDPKAGIGYRLCVEAVDAAHAERRMREITESYNDSGSCPCCGPRWFFWIDDADGTEEPSGYGGDRPLTGGWGIPSYIHYIDGRIEATEVRE